MNDYQRTQAQVAEHYAIEKDLARQLLDAPREARRHLYSSLYDELFRRVPHHPQLVRKASAELVAGMLARQLRFLGQFLNRDMSFLEIGPGACALSHAVAPLVSHVYGIDVSDEITKGLQHPSNFQLILSDGCSIPLPPGSIDIAYSNQLMEHLHPDDALEQLKNIYDVLKPGGMYICITPNSVNGPHDVSAGFDPIATGFHLKEYTLKELRVLFRTVGFSRVRTYIEIRRLIRAPMGLLLALERTLQLLPHRPRELVGKSLPCRLLLGKPLIAVK
jgi:SAM-dependent methyltransferase